MCSGQLYYFLGILDSHFSNTDSIFHLNFSFHNPFVLLNHLDLLRILLSIIILQCCLNPVVLSDSFVSNMHQSICTSHRLTSYMLGDLVHFRKVNHMLCSLDCALGLTDRMSRSFPRLLQRFVSDLLLAVFVGDLSNNFHVMFNQRLVVCCYLPLMSKLLDMVNGSLLMVSYLSLQLFYGFLMLPELFAQLG